MSSRAEQKAAARQRRIEAEEAAAAKAARTRRLQILGGVLGLAVVVVVIAVVVSSGGGSSTAAPSKTGKPAGTAQVAARFAGLPERGLTLGRPDAPLTMIEFADLKCPVCREYTLGAFPTIVKKYVRTGKLKIELRLQTFVGSPPGDSAKAARMALAASQQDKMWPFADLYYLNQQDESTGYNSDAYLRHIGSGVQGLNVDKAMAARSSADVQTELSQAASEFSSAGFTGTPSFLVGKTGGKLQPLNPSSFGDPSAYTGTLDGLLK
jgi:protein-disulfide isomerase